MNRYSTTLIALGLLTGCTTAPPPPLTADHPASPSAPEAPVRATPNALGADGLTRKTHQILAQAAKEQQQSERSGPDVDDQKGQQMKNTPNLQPLQQQPAPAPPPQQQQMPGLQMPQGQSQPSPTPNN